MDLLDKKLRIMIVEDDPLIRQLYVKILTERGFQVIGIASDGVEAMKVYNQLHEKPNLIILDYRMPHKNGLEVTKELQRLNSTSDILMISGDPRVDSAELISQGVKFKQKPIQLGDLLKEIRLIGCC